MIEKAYTVAPSTSPMARVQTTSEPSAAMPDNAIAMQMEANPPFIFLRAIPPTRNLLSQISFPGGERSTGPFVSRPPTPPGGGAFVFSMFAEGDAALRRRETK